MVGVCVPSPEPTTATMPRPRSTVTSPKPRSSVSTASSCVSASMVTETLTSDVAMTSMDSLKRSKTAKMPRTMPGVPSMRDDLTLTTTTLARPATARTGRRGASNVMRVPSACGRCEL